VLNLSYEKTFNINTINSLHTNVSIYADNLFSQYFLHKLCGLITVLEHSGHVVL